MTEQLEYETFVLRAFSLKDGEMLERSGDPAELGSTEICSDRNLVRAKAATSYAMEIFFNNIRNNRQDISDVEDDRIMKFTEDVINASSISDVLSLISEYRETVEDRYYTVEGEAQKLNLG